MSSVISSLSLFVLTVAIVFLAIYLIKLSKSVQDTLKNLDEFLYKSQSSIDKTLAQVDPVISKLSELEDTTENTLTEINQRLPLIDNQLARLLEELTDTSKVYQDLGRSFSKDLPLILENVHKITININELTDNIKTGVEQTRDFFDAVHETSKTVRVATDIGRSRLSGLAVQIASMATGIKTSLEFLSENIRFRGGSKNEQ
jgi:uncharacterized protein YoxC